MCKMSLCSVPSGSACRSLPTVRATSRVPLVVAQAKRRLFAPPGRAARAQLARTWTSSREGRSRRSGAPPPASYKRLLGPRRRLRRRREQAQGLLRPVDPPTRFHKALAFQLQLQC